MAEGNPLPGTTLTTDDASLHIIANLVRMHIPVRDLVRLQVVSKEWQSWCSENSKQLWEARRLQSDHGTRISDWYFPTGWKHFECECTNQPCYKPIHSQFRKWSGVHHSSETEHLLPSLRFLPDWTADPETYKFLTGADGLLLFGRISRTGHEEAVVTLCDFVVCNPLTKKWKVLPTLNEISQNIKLWHGEFPNEISPPHEIGPTIEIIHLVVDHMANTYTIVIVSSTLMWTYNSNSRFSHWVTSKHVQPKGLLFGSTTCTNGCIFMLEQLDDQHVVAHTYCIDTGQWLPEIHTLYNERMFDAGGHFLLPVPEVPYVLPTFWRGPKLVACSGDVYAIVPVRLKVHFRAGGLRTSGTIVFQIFQLHAQRHMFAFRVELPLRVRYGRGSLLRKIFSGDRPGSWYSCTANANVIWLACRDRLLHWNVVTGKSHVSLTSPLSCPVSGGGDVFMPYEPNFHVSP